MVNEYQSVEALIDGVKGSTNFISSLVSQKSGLVLLLIALGVIISKLLI